VLRLFNKTLLIYNLIKNQEKEFLMQRFNFCYLAMACWLTLTGCGGGSSPPTKTTSTPNPTPAPTLSISDINADAGGTASLKVTLSKTSSQAITVDYATNNHTALAGTHYTAKAGTLTFAAGETERFIEVITLATGTYQPDNKTLLVELSNATNALIADGSGTITIKPAVPAESAGLTLSFGKIKTLSFSWQDVTDGTFYQLFEDADGQSGYSQVGMNIQPNIQGIDHIVPLYARINARYLLKSCNPVGCVESDPVYISERLSDMVASIGYLKASNTMPYGYFGDMFGYSVSLSADGNTLAVGAIEEDSNAVGIGGSEFRDTAKNSGAVYLFVRTGHNWSQQAYIKASNTGADDWFGSALSLSADGNTLAVGAYGEDSNATGIDGDQGNNNADNSGAAYVFARAGEDWTQQAYIKASNTDADDWFGSALSLSADGNTLAIGAHGEESNVTGIIGDQTNNTADNSGAAYIFARTGEGWLQQAYIKASNKAENDGFGYSLSLSGDGKTLAVSASGEDSNATGIGGDQTNNDAEDSGAVYLFVRTAEDWFQQAYIKASNTVEYDEFGYSLSLSADGSTLVVGAPYEQSDSTGIDGDQGNNNAYNSGAVYAFTRTGEDWSQQAYIKASNTGVDNFFGCSVSTSADGKKLAVGAFGENSKTTGIDGDQTNNVAQNSGVTYTFVRDDTGWQQQAYIKASNTDANDQFGNSVSLSADGNSLAIGAMGEESNAKGIDGDQTNNIVESSGAVYIY
jgi:hypothetical protein